MKKTEKKHPKVFWKKWVILVSLALIVLFSAFLAGAFVPEGFHNPNNYNGVMIYPGSDTKFLLFQIFVYFFNFLPFTVSTIVFFWYCLRGPNLRFTSFVCWTVSLFLSIVWIFSIPESLLFSGASNYANTGEYLRINHGLNVYFMDQGGWIATFFFGELLAYTTIIFLFVRYLAVNYFFKRNKSD